MTSIDQILFRMKYRNTLVCCGLDPDLSKIPLEISKQKISDEEKIYKFLCSVVDVTAQHVCVYKAQKAFFDIFDGGHELLKMVIAYVHKNYPDIPVVVDCKIGDTLNTMSIYIKNIFGSLNADGVVVNPYMGDDTMFPLAELSAKAIVVLVETSNPSGAIVQNVILQNGLPFWRYILSLVVNRWNYNQNMIPVISANSTWDVSEVRSSIPIDMPILFAGVGAQGGNYTNLPLLLNSEKSGVFVNSSRDILYPGVQNPWLGAIETAVIKLKRDLNEIGGRYV